MYLLFGIIGLFLGIVYECIDYLLKKRKKELTCSETNP